MNVYKEAPPPYSEAPTGVHQQYYQPPTAPNTEQYGQADPISQSQPLNNQRYPSYAATHTTVIVPQQEIIIVGACPACRIGVLEDDYTCLGIFCAIFFFPLGVLCCLALKNRRCSNCGAYFG